MADRTSQAAGGTGARQVAGERDATALAAAVVDPGRAQPIVCVTTQSYLREPMLDVDELARRLDGHAEVWVVSRAQDGWALTEALPPGLDVYGGAVRIWTPIAAGQAARSSDHPSFTVFTKEDATRVRDEVVDRIAPAAPAPQPGDELYAVVTGVLPAGAELTLTTGHAAFVANAHIVSAGEVFHAREALRPGQQVRVRVSEAGSNKRRTKVTMRPFAPDPWTRLAELYEPGAVVEGVVVRFEQYGAFVELLPGAQGLVHLSKIAKAYVADPQDFLELEERAIVKIIALDAAERRAELSIIDVNDEQPEAIAALFPSGPPWLSATEEVEHDNVDLEPLIALDADSPPVTAEAPAPEPTGPLEDQPEAPARDEETQHPPPTTPDEGIAETQQHAERSVAAEELHAAIDAGTQLENDLNDLLGGAERRLGQLRGHAQQLTASLEARIGEAELRILRLAADETEQIVTTSEQATRDLTDRITELEGRLQVAERDREQLITQLRNSKERHDRVAEARDHERSAALRAGAETKKLRLQLDQVDGGDEELRFLRELQFTWAQNNTTEEDRRRYPLRQVILGPDFLASIKRTEGVSRQRVLEVCSHVTSDRAAELANLELHQLRTGRAGDAPTRVRSDGATAWRVSLQRKTPSARRLHYWQLNDGRIELAKIGVHDDFEI